MTKLAITLGLWGAYLVTFPAVHDVTGGIGGAPALSLIPLTLTSWFYGFRVSLAAALATNVVNVLLLLSQGFQVPSTWAVAVAAGSVFVMAGIIGKASSLQAEVLDQRRELQHRSRHDPLTGALTRAALTELAPSILGPTSSAATLYLDLDGFKEINDTHGHAAGDEVLRRVVARFASVLRTSDLIARMGGDEFVVVAPGLSRPEDAHVVAEKLLSAFDAPYRVDGVDLRVGASLGMSLFPGDAEDLAALLERADRSLYRAKREGGRGYRLYDANVDRVGGRRHRLEAELAGALERNELTLLLQPRVRLADGHVVALQAEARWRHPTAGHLTDGEVEAIAREAGLGAELTTWCLREGSRVVADLEAVAHGPVRLAVPATRAFLLDTNAASMTCYTLREARLPPDRVEFLVREAVLETDGEAARDTLAALRDLGARVALDRLGFDTGSLTVLRRAPLDGVQVHRSLLDEASEPGQRSAESTAWLQSLADLLHGANLDAIAMGVDGPKLEASLRTAGFDAAQGPHVAPSMTVTDARGWLRHAGHTSCGTAAA